MDNEKPSLVIHIGPSKTGSTSLQKLLKESKPVLRKDKYRALGFGIPHEDATKPTTKIYRKLLLQNWKCWNSSLVVHNDNEASSTARNVDFAPGVDMQTTYDQMKQLDCWKYIAAGLDEIRADNYGIIMSDEALSHGKRRFMYHKHRQGFLILSLFAKELTLRWNVKIVIVYRRYYEWILSVFKESNNKVLLRYKECPTTSQLDGMLRNPWPEISKWMRNPNKVLQKFHYQYPDLSYPLWNAAGFDDIEIVNFLSPAGTKDSTPDDLFRHFICNIVPNATHTCDWTRRQQAQATEAVHANAQRLDTTVYDQIVCAAQQRLDPSKWKNMPIKRKEAAQELQSHHQTILRLSWTDLPLVCPTDDELRSLLDLSLAKEKALAPSFFQENQAEHQQSFCGVAQKKSFCNVDLDHFFQTKNFTWPESWAG